MKTVVIQIGNSDDKLTQVQWSDYCIEIQVSVSFHSIQIHFGGGSSYDKEWQNACWVSDVGDDKIQGLKDDLVKIKNTYGQESISIIIGKNEFI